MTTQRDQTLFSTARGHQSSSIESEKQEKANSPYLIVEQAAYYLRVSKAYRDKWVEERIYASTTQYKS